MARQKREPAPKADEVQPEHVGTVPEGLVAWADLGRMKLSLYENDINEGEREPGLNYTLNFRMDSGRKFGFVLSLFTTQELIVMRDMLNLAISKALPVTELRDQHAAKALKEHQDDSFARLWRPVPRLVDRTRLQPGDGSGVPSRSRPLSSMGRRDGQRPAPAEPVGSDTGPDEYDTAFPPA